MTDNANSSSSSSSSPSSSSATENKSKRSRKSKNTNIIINEEGEEVQAYYRQGQLIHRRTRKRHPDEEPRRSKSKSKSTSRSPSSTQTNNADMHNSASASSSSPSAPIPIAIPSMYSSIIPKTNFIASLPTLMYASGDVEEPLPESVLVMDELLTSHLSGILVDAFNVMPNRADRLPLDNFLYVLRRYPKRLERVNHILHQNRIKARGLRHHLEAKKQRKSKE